MYSTLWEECKQTHYPVPPQKLKGKDYNSDVILKSNNSKKLIYQVRANTYDFWLSSHYMENTIAIYSYSTPWALFPQKWCFAPEFFVLISSHCSTQIWRMRNGGSWFIYFLNYIISYFTIQPKRQLWGGATTPENWGDVT